MGSYKGWKMKILVFGHTKGDIKSASDWKDPGAWAAGKGAETEVIRLISAKSSRLACNRCSADLPAA
jgi:hypothetical protein